MAANGKERNGLREFIASISTIRGDLSNITAPPFVLADKSTTEFPQYWIEHPDLFCAPAKEQDPAKRALAVLKWFLSSLRSQQYAGRNPGQGIKKPLNAYLGELFLGEIGPEGDETRLVSEQVSHHPPVTACYLWNDKHGIRAEGYTRQQITFTGSVNIQQIGHAVLHLDKWDEDFLIPLPNIKVNGVLTGSPYPELNGSYSIVCSSGFVAKVDFTGKGVLGIGGKKNHVVAALYRLHEKVCSVPLFSVDGCWTEDLVFKDGSGKEIETYSVASASATEIRTLPLEQQDEWESRKAWSGVIKALNDGNMQAVSDSKSTLEKGQRQLRKRSDTSADNWEALFFRKTSSSPVAEKLLSEIDERLNAEQTCGVWRFHGERATQLRRPWRGDLKPTG